MLTWNELLDYIKMELCLPNHVLEKTDDELKEYIIAKVFPIFEQYVPDEGKCVINTRDPKFIYDKSTFYIFDDQDRDIITIKDVIFDESVEYMFGRNPVGPLSWSGVPEYELSDFMATNTKLFSKYNYTFEFIHPNKVRVSPLYEFDKLVIMYERKHAEDLSSIPNVYEYHFKELSIAMVMQLLGRIRKRYQNIQTPFGEINLSADDLYSEGNERLNNIVEQLKSLNLTNIIFDRG